MSSNVKLHWTRMIVAMAATLIAACRDNPVAMDGQPFDASTLGDLARVRGDENANSTDPVDRFRHRFSLNVAPEGDFRANAPIILRVAGVATEAIEAGEIVVTLPTQASMAFAGPGNSLDYPLDRRFPVVARWQIGRMAAGDTWRKGRIPVGTVGPGYYKVAIHIETRGPNSTSFLLNTVYRKAWLFVTADGGTITEFFDESLFPDSISPKPGPFQLRPPYRLNNSTGTATTQTMAVSVNGSMSNVVTVRVNYHFRDRTYDAHPATGANVWARKFDARVPDEEQSPATNYRTVPSTGIVTFACPGPGKYLLGGANLPSNSDVGGGPFLKYWEATQSDCGRTITATGFDEYYLPWKNLREIVPIVERHTGYHKSSQSWGVDRNPGNKRSRYRTTEDRIVFGLDSYWSKIHSRPRVRPCAPPPRSRWHLGHGKCLPRSQRELYACLDSTARSCHLQCTLRAMQ